jgi:ABC-type glycerol-3-phosphate transport system permease component
MVSSAFQPENEITSKPPHWIAHNPTIENFRVIFTSEKQEVTYENR